MEIKIIESKNISFAEIISETIVISTVQDALDLMANCRYQGSEHIIIQKEHITEEFFDLKSGIAGEILQKFSNYRCHLAIIGDFSNIQSKSLRDFIYESNKTGRICFVANIDDAFELMTRK